MINLNSLNQPINIENSILLAINSSEWENNYMFVQWLIDLWNVELSQINHILLNYLLSIQHFTTFWEQTSFILVFIWIIAWMMSQKIALVCITHGENLFVGF